jgi:hypothetical protein
MVRIIGDIHGNYKQHLKLIEGADYSLQLGDLGFDYQYLIDNNVDPDRHKFFGGNHDNYDKISESPHNLGDFGVWSVPNFGDIFFVRGAWSIDWKYRIIGLSWWHDEELSLKKLDEAIELYSQVKPKILITHACPKNIVKFVTDPEVTRSFGYEQSEISTKTDEMLQIMLQHHIPKLHVFGHFHCNFDKWIDGRCGIERDSVDKDNDTDYTRYVCLPEFGVLELDDFDF